MLAFDIAFTDDTFWITVGITNSQIVICLGILKSFLKALDDEHYEYYHGEDARGKSVVIHHIPAIASKGS